MNIFVHWQTATYWCF